MLYEYCMIVPGAGALDPGWHAKTEVRDKESASLLSYVQYDRYNEVQGWRTLDVMRNK